MQSKIARVAAVAALLAAAAAAASLTRRKGVEFPPVAPEPPRIEDISPPSAQRR
ncbi:hypothetical protein [Gordonia sp. CPCC 205333]|uniref:hypothetical protein n=1 Tax=Gordonia sp. CPCC 205333 TaxID=3140790 RepID=UPI003AF357B1